MFTTAFTGGLAAASVVDGMAKAWIKLVVPLTAAAAFVAPAPASVRVVIDGRAQEIPDGVIRTITAGPDGHRIVRDEPFPGAVMPGAATITTTETTDEDGRGRAIRTTVVTRIVPLAAVAYTPRRDEPSLPQPPRAVSQSAIEPVAFESAEADSPQGRALRIDRDPATGHFIATVKVNGVAVRAIVDTGASNTILSPRDAQATGASKDLAGAQRMIGIGGYTMLNLARVRSLEVGGEDLGGFTAAIGQQGLGYTLLGQSEIARLGRITIEAGVMTILPRADRFASR
jgi:clan AA aspartic protease (TIGR02281 family)